MLKIHMLEQVVNTENVCENAQELSPKRKVPAAAHGGGSSSSNGGTPIVSATSSPHHQPTPPQRHIHTAAGGKSVSQGSSPAGLSRSLLYLNVVRWAERWSGRDQAIVKSNK